MQLNISILSTLIALAIAGPLPEAQPARRTVSAALAQTCAILGTNVNCRYHAKTGVDSPVQWVFSGGSAFFTCNSPGECISGNCMWDYNPDHDCFVSAHYTGSNCNPSTLPNCGFSK